MTDSNVGVVYAIRHKPSGFFMPEAKGKLRRGSSWWEPETQAEHPRLFSYKRSATAAITQWLRGKQVADYSWENDYPGGPNYQVHDGTSVIECPHRKREDMEVVTINLCIAEAK